MRLPVDVRARRRSGASGLLGRHASHWPHRLSWPSWVPVGASRVDNSLTAAVGSPRRSPLVPRAPSSAATRPVRYDDAVSKLAEKLPEDALGIPGDARVMVRAGVLANTCSVVADGELIER